MPYLLYSQNNHYCKSVENKIDASYNNCKKEPKSADTIQVEVKIDNSCNKPKVIILTSSISENINGSVMKLSKNIFPIILGSNDEKIQVIEQSD